MHFSTFSSSKTHLEAVILRLFYTNTNRGKVETKRGDYWHKSQNYLDICPSSYTVKIYALTNAAKFRRFLSYISVENVRRISSSSSSSSSSNRSSSRV